VLRLGMNDLPLALAAVFYWSSGQAKRAGECGDVRICVMTAFASSERPNRQHHCSNASVLSITAHSFCLILCPKSTGKMIRSKKALLHVSPYPPNQITQKGFLAKLCPIFARIAPGIAVKEEILLWQRECENVWMRPGYGVFGGHFMP
jgi:hypothetical protein